MRRIALALALSLLVAVPVLAHNCVENTAITSAPGSVTAGGSFSASGGFDNCGNQDTTFEVTWALVGASGRIQLLQRFETVRTGQSTSFTDSLTVPLGTPAGSYDLVLKIVAPGGFTDSDSTPITVN